MADIADQWPNCVPPTAGTVFSGFSDGHRQYKKAEVEPGHWQWVVDEEANARLREHEKRRQELWWALRTRVLSDDEMEQVRGWGSGLNTPPMASYRADEKARELNDALYNQARLRILANQQGGGDE